MAFKTLARTSYLTRGLVLAGCLNLALACHAEAQERKVTISRDKLPPVTWFKAPLLIDIVDETPRVNDLRSKSSAPSYEITIPPLPQAQATRNLVPVNLNGSNINRNQQAKRNLPSTSRPIYAMNDTAAPGRPVGSFTAPGKLPRLSPPQSKPGPSTSTSTYADSESGYSPFFSSSSRTFPQGSKAVVRGKLLKN